MSVWPTILKSILKIGERIASYCERKQLIDAGVAKEQKESLKEGRDAVSKAISARRVARREFKRNGGMPKDYKYWR